MKRSDVHFNIYVSPVRRLHWCDEARKEYDNGYSGFHQSHKCPNCRYEETGFEMWGENHHLQGSAPNRARLAHWLRHKAKEQWRMKDGSNRIMGYRFKVGSTQTYLA